MREGALPGRDHLLDDPHPTVGGAPDEAVRRVRLVGQLCCTGRLSHRCLSRPILDLPAQGLDGQFPVGRRALCDLSPAAQSHILPELSCHSPIWRQGICPLQNFNLLSAPGSCDAQECLELVGFAQALKSIVKVKKKRVFHLVCGWDVLQEQVPSRSWHCQN